MEKMRSDAPLDYAVFQLSPKHSRCELFVSSGGSTEKLASGLLKPFVAHLKVAEEQVASATQSIMLDPGRNRNADAWFTKGTLDRYFHFFNLYSTSKTSIYLIFINFIFRFVRFVSTPEVLEVVNTFDAEMSQLEAARRIYSQGVGDQLSGGGGSGLTAADYTTKKELLRAIDVRLEAARRDLTNACARAAAAGFDVGTVSELQIFADRFGAHCLNEACGKFLSLFERRPNLINQWKSVTEDWTIRSSCNSDMSIDLPSPPIKDFTTHQHPNPPSITFPLRRTFSRESNAGSCGENKQDNATGENNTKDVTSAPDTKDSILVSQPSRRLSVQDRINMFENKQKDNSGGKPIVKSVELRRLSSDVSMMGAATEKGVLRRWSGVSDMSIDLSAEMKDAGSPLCASSLETFSQENKDLDLNNYITKSFSVVKPESNVLPSLNMDSNNSLKDDFDNSEQLSRSAKSISYLNSDGSDGSNNQGHNKAKPRSFIGKSDNQETSEERSKILSGGGSRPAFAFDDHMKSRDSQKDEDLTETRSEITGGKDQSPSLAEGRLTSSKSGGRVRTVYAKEDYETRHKSVVQSSLKTSWKTVEESWASERVSGSSSHEDFIAHHKEIKDSSSALQDSRFTGETEILEIKEAIEVSEPQRIKLNRKVSELCKKAKIMPEGNIRTPFSGKIMTEAEEGFDSFANPTPDLFQRGRQSMGNQDRNDELKLKANELEKLFAEHKLRVPADQSNSTHKGKLYDTNQLPSSFQCAKIMTDSSPQFSDSYKPNEPTGNLKNKIKLNTASSMKLIDNQNYGDALRKSFSDLSVSEGSRGKLYQRYYHKRDAKLKEDWSCNRADKEARLKSMQDSLERNKYEMKAKLSGSADREDPVFSARRRAERLRSYNSRAILNREQNHQDFVDFEFGGNALAFQKNNHIEERVVGGISFEDGFPLAGQGKQLLSNNRNSSSTTPRSSAVPFVRSAAKTSTNSLKRRMQPENPLAQSVPNFSDLRKENTKPSSGGGKSTRSQVRNYARGKTTNEETAIVEEDKSRRLQTSRKISTNRNEFEDISTLDSEGVALTQIKFDEEKNMVTKPFLRKGSRAVRTSIARQRVTIGSKTVNNVDENDGIASEPDEFKNIVPDEREKDLKNLNSEGDNVLEHKEPTLELDPNKFENSGSENGGDTLTFSALDQALGSKLPREIPSCFLPVDSMQDWQNGSPMSWNSHTQNPFSYPHETSDIDAYVDSSIGSPSWNLHSSNSMEADTARMRKKWSAAQKPMVVAHSSNSSPRKDMARGFKRLLKFGRKNRGSETLADWVSVTTSEGDDDTEDGRDLPNRSSEDLRKSRMGFSQAQPSDDSFNNSEYFNESVQSSQSSIPAPPANFRLREDHVSGTSIKAPRSFFSLSTFRNKGNESKPR